MIGRFFTGKTFPTDASTCSLLLPGSDCYESCPHGGKCGMRPHTFYNCITQHKSKMFFTIAKEPQPLTTVIMIANFQLQTARGDLKKDSSVGRWSSMSLKRWSFVLFCHLQHQPCNIFRKRVPTNIIYSFLILQFLTNFLRIAYTSIATTIYKKGIYQWKLCQMHLKLGEFYP